MSRIKLLLSAVFFSAATSLHGQITVSSSDNFNTTVEGWTEGSGGSPNPPIWVSGDRNGGASGHLRNESVGGVDQAGGKLHMWNTGLDWTGNYASAGVGFIDFWVDRSTIGTALSLRIGFEGSGGWFASDAQAVTNGTGWINLFFELDSMNFTHITDSGGTASFSDTMTLVSNFEIFSSVGLPSFANPMMGPEHLRGDQIIADLRIDDINASAIPEPKYYALGIGLLAIVLIVIKRRGRS